MIVLPGTPIAIVAPCGIYDPTRFEDGLAIARSFGIEVRPYPDMLRPLRYLAAPDDHRLAQLVDAIRSPENGAVWMARGGYGLTRLLGRLPDDLPPKPIIGFSDVTVLFSALHPRRIGPLIHGPMPHSLPTTDEASRQHLFALLAGKELEPLVGESWVEGAAEGPLVGGNLALIASICGTPWQLDARGAILVLEDLGEAPYRIDRLLQQLESSGVFRGVAGIAFGEFTRCDPPPEATWTLKEVLMEFAGRLGVPVVGDLPIGHGSRNRAFRWGVRARLSGGRLLYDGA